MDPSSVTDLFIVFNIELFISIYWIIMCTMQYTVQTLICQYETFYFLFHVMSFVTWNWAIQFYYDFRAIIK